MIALRFLKKSICDQAEKDISEYKCSDFEKIK